MTARDDPAIIPADLQDTASLIPLNAAIDFFGRLLDQVANLACSLAFDVWHFLFCHRNY